MEEPLRDTVLLLADLVRAMSDKLDENAEALRIHSAALHRLATVLEEDKEKLEGDFSR